MTKWPKDTMKAKVAFYGDPRGTHGVNPTWYKANIVRVSCPWRLYFAGKEVKSVPIHKHCADALRIAFKEIWEACDKSQKTARDMGWTTMVGRSPTASSAGRRPRYPIIHSRSPSIWLLHKIRSAGAREKCRY